MLQIVGEQRRERKGGEQFQPGSANQIPDLDAAQLAETPGRNCSGNRVRVEEEKTKKKKSEW